MSPKVYLFIPYVLASAERKLHICVEMFSLDLACNHIFGPSNILTHRRVRGPHTDRRYYLANKNEYVSSIDEAIYYQQQYQE